MVTVILGNAPRSFAGVYYNFNKVDQQKAELMKSANFGPVSALSNHRPQDFINYFKTVSAQNKNIVNTQFHAVLSGAGQRYSKHELTGFAVEWLKEMGYGEQPYLIFFHKDTDNNHVHMVTSRVDRDGKKISGAFEKVRAQRITNRLLGYNSALKYSFSTPAQFYMIIENLGFRGKEYDAKKLTAKIDKHQPDKLRAAELKDLFLKHKEDPEFVARMKDRFQLELIFHASAGKAPYGYSVIDHATKQVFKGSEILNLKHLSADTEQRVYQDTHSANQLNIANQLLADGEISERISDEIYVRPVWIADDIDDQGVLGRNRNRKKKARTNTR